jgi:hypothetical protein
LTRQLPAKPFRDIELAGIEGGHGVAQRRLQLRGQQ